MTIYISFIISYFICGFFGLTIIIDKIPTFKFLMKWVGLKNWNKERSKYISLKLEYDRQEIFKTQQEVYKDYK